MIKRGPPAYLDKCIYISDTGDKVRDERSQPMVDLDMLRCVSEDREGAIYLLTNALTTSAATGTCTVSRHRHMHAGRKM